MDVCREDVPESHVPVTLMMLALTVTLLGVAVLAVRASGRCEHNPPLMALETSLPVHKFCQSFCRAACLGHV